ncbi:MAG TPA: hypothetical protein VFL85_00055 [Candidatus Saccharimonadales bacterium]|nr:hypothetical protein [Candidatus Saccharimonadales bacterium]
MAEKSPKRPSRPARSEAGERRSTYGNTDPNHMIAGISMRGLSEQVHVRRRKGAEINVQKIDPAIMEVALELAQNDPRRIELNDDGSVTVKNNPS